MKPKAYYEVSIGSSITIIPFRHIKEGTYQDDDVGPRFVFVYIGGGFGEESGEDATKMYNAYKEWIDSQ